MNLIFDNIFKKNVHYKCISTEAIRIVSYFHKFSYFTENLKNEQI